MTGDAVEKREIDLLLAFIAREILTGVDPALRRAVKALYFSYMEQAKEIEKLEEKAWKYDDLCK